MFSCFVFLFFCFMFFYLGRRQLYCSQRFHFCLFVYLLKKSQAYSLTVEYSLRMLVSHIQPVKLFSNEPTTFHSLFNCLFMCVSP